MPIGLLGPRKPTPETLQSWLSRHPEQKHTLGHRYCNILPDVVCRQCRMATGHVKKVSAPDEHAAIGMVKLIAHTVFGVGDVEINTERAVRISKILGAMNTMYTFSKNFGLLFKEVVDVVACKFVGAPVFGVNVESLREETTEQLKKMSDFVALTKADLTVLKATEIIEYDSKIRETIKHVMSGINPQGCQVSSFKAPSPEDLDHDFLWRCLKHLPERGRIGIFNRSYY